MITAADVYRTWYKIYGNWMSPGECAVEVDLLDTQIRLLGELRGRWEAEWRETVRAMKIKRFALKRLLDLDNIKIRIHKNRKDNYGKTHS